MGVRTDIGESFGALLRRYRLAAGLTQEALAERASLSVRNVPNLERGANRPLRDTVRRLADALDLPAEEHARFLATPPPRRRPRGLEGVDTLVARPDALPLPPTALVGREREAAEVDALLRRDDLRALTLVGPGGVGKTRLALHAAHAAQERFADGAIFVDLTPLHDPALALPAVAQALGLTAQGSRPAAEVLAAHLRERQLLLVLDNCEHLLDAAPEVALLRVACPCLRVLATSRVALRVRGEQVYPVPPLAIPAPSRLPPLAALELEQIAALEQVAAVALFVQRARAADLAFALSPTNAAAVAAICARLDGLPLAIELAAARVVALPPTALAARLDRPLGLLVGGPRDAPARHWTLRDTIAWSYDLLPTAEQALFRRLAPFAGGCTVEAAAAVGMPHDPTVGADVDDVAEGLAALVDAHLLRVAVGDTGEPRYRLLATVREYALEQIEASGESALIRERHAAYYLTLAEAAVARFHDAGLPRALDALDGELDNLRAALAWCVERGQAGDGLAAEHGMALTADLYPFWLIRPHLREGAAWLDRLLPTPGAAAPTPGRALALAMSTVAAMATRDVAMVRARSAECLALAPALDDPLARGRASLMAAYLSLFPLEGTPDPRAARTVLHEALALFGAVAPPWRWEALSCLWFLGMTSAQRGNFADAVEELSASVVQSERQGNIWVCSMVLGTLGCLTWARGDVDGARAYIKRLAATSAALSDTQSGAFVSYLLGQLAEEDGDATGARASYARALAQVGEVGDFALTERSAPAIAIMYVSARQEVSPRALRYAAATFGLPQAEGRPLTLQQAVAAASSALDAEGRAEPAS